MNINNLLKKLTIEEKIGQLMQLAPFFFIGDLKKEVYGPIEALGLDEDEVFLAGSVLGIGSADEMKRVQNSYLKRSRHKIPLIFMADIIHGYKTIFPVPLAMAASFNPELVKKAARISAIEAQTAGIHVTFSPMSDLSRDPRWGRVVESFGEDPYLNGVFSKAMVEGYQHDGIDKIGNLASCVKHFAAYGASEAGRDYNTVDISRLNLHQYYLSGYKKALEAGAQLVMTSFNIFEGVPATTNQYLLKELLREKWEFNGVIISDYDSLPQTIAHGTSEDELDAAKKGLLASLDIEMASASYMNNLKKLIEEGHLDIKLLDEAVLRVLKLKKDLGLFNDPYKGADSRLEEILVLSKEHLDVALSLARESLVLLKNDNLLPLDKKEKVIIIGSYAKENNTMGPWSWHGKKEDIMPLDKAISMYGEVLLSKPVKSLAELTKDDITLIKKSDVVILAMGEESSESGEAKSKTNLRLSLDEKEIIKYIKSLKKRSVLVLYNGRPLVLSEITPYVDGIIETFFLGTMSSEAIAETLYGHNNPSGKLPMSFPRSEGQIPVYYNHLNTGRPAKNKNELYASTYLDSSNEPLYPFGFGLSYSEFIYEKIALDKKEITKDETLKVKIDVTNKSKFAGKETIQLYIRDYKASVSRPVKELKQFKKIYFKPFEKKTVLFEVTKEDLKYINTNLKRTIDKGLFAIMIGGSSDKLLKETFEVI